MYEMVSHFLKHKFL